MFLESCAQLYIENHIMWEVSQDFWSDRRQPLCLGFHLHVWEWEKLILKIFYRAPSEIEAPGTPNVSQGTKILGSKIFSYNAIQMLFYENFWFIGQNLKFYAKNMQIWQFSLCYQENGKNITDQELVNGIPCLVFMSGVYVECLCST